MSKVMIKTRLWDPAEHLSTAEDISAYLQAAFEEGDPRLIAAALGDIARAKGMAQIARDTGLGRESLYKALSADGNPEFSTVMRVVQALGLQLRTVAHLQLIDDASRGLTDVAAGKVKEARGALSAVKRRRSARSGKST